MDELWYYAFIEIIIILLMACFLLGSLWRRERKCARRYSDLIQQCFLSKHKNPSDQFAGLEQILVSELNQLNQIIVDINAHAQMDADSEGNDLLGMMQMRRMIVETELKIVEDLRSGVSYVDSLQKHVGTLFDTIKSNYLSNPDDDSLECSVDDETHKEQSFTEENSQLKEEIIQLQKQLVALKDTAADDSKAQMSEMQEKEEAHISELEALKKQIQNVDLERTQLEHQIKELEQSSEQIELNYSEKLEALEKEKGELLQAQKAAQENSESYDSKIGVIEREKESIRNALDNLLDQQRHEKDKFENELLALKTQKEDLEKKLEKSMNKLKKIVEFSQKNSEELEKTIVEKEQKNNELEEKLRRLRKETEKAVREISTTYADIIRKKDKKIKTLETNLTKYSGDPYS